MQIKSILVLALLAIGGSAAYAQGTDRNETALHFQRDFVANIAPSGGFKAYASTNTYQEEKYRRFRKMRTGGIVLTSMGAGLIFVGAALIQSANNDSYYTDYDDDYYYHIEDSDGKIIGGALCIGAGVLSMGGGITMWIIGNNKMKKYGGGSVTLKNTKSGVGLVYNF
ncbi:MAG TPA: hypothetical protein PK191_00510 [Niabella sp.]|nr:hypothetical protein [Niabella sp.]HOZ96583.1 hypothetical protein [Niabella sp.]HQW13236.1 hypothetical protein [Niabella sp.]HQX18724.1 hypothetical protein [Niabella sp.]HQX41610.1 hypothetical protein [Niabella sp.]